MQKKILTFMIAALVFMISFGQDNTAPTLVVKAAYYDKLPGKKTAHGKKG